MRRCLVFTLFFCVLAVTPQITRAASLSVSPSSGTYSVGDSIILRVIASSSDAPMNAVAGVLAFPSALFSIESVSKGNSILNFWVTEPVFSNSAGTVQFEGVSLSGFQGSAGTVVTVTVRAKSAGSGTVSFQSGQVLANDGQGTDITSGLGTATFTIVPAKPTVRPKVPEVVEPETRQPSVTLDAPIITLDREQDLPVILGTSAYANANVLLTYIPVSGVKIFITGATDINGNFSLPVPRALRNGPYAVNAVVVRDGLQSGPSNTLTVEVGGVFVADISWETATYVSFFLMLLLLMLIAYLIWRRYFGPKRRASVALRKELKAAEDAVHKSFNVLDQDLTDHVRVRKDSADVPDTEQQDIADIKKDLVEAERYIDKEIKDIGRVPIDEKD